MGGHHASALGRNQVLEVETGGGTKLETQKVNRKRHILYPERRFMATSLSCFTAVPALVSCAAWVPFVLHRNANI